MPAFNATELFEGAIAAAEEGTNHNVYSVLAGQLVARFDLGPTPGMVPQLYALAALFAV
jgi:hypothetical protein